MVAMKATRDVGQFNTCFITMAQNITSISINTEILLVCDCFHLTKQLCSLKILGYPQHKTKILKARKARIFSAGLFTAKS